MERRNEPEPITVTDKRRFAVDTSGKAVEEKDDHTPTPQTEHAAPSQPKEPPREEPNRSASEGREIPLPEVDFATFILSLSQSAVFHLGLVENPMTGKKDRNLPIAKHTIDTIAMLEQKTRGNLSQEEAQLLEHILAELRLHYVEELNKK